MNDRPRLEAEEIHLPLRGSPRGGLATLLRRKWLWLVLVCIAAAAGYFFFTKAGDSQQTAGPGGRSGTNATGRPTPVVTAMAKTGNMNIYLNGLGTVTPLHTVMVRTRVDGELTKVLFREGQLIKQGDLLAEIDPRPYQVLLTQAEGQLARDTALLKNAQADLERYRTLYEQDSIAKQQLDTQAALVRQYEGAIKSDQGQIDGARLQLTYSRITAPVSGRLGLRQVDPGNIVHASDASGLVVITQLQPISVIFTLPEDNLPAVMKKLQVGENMSVEAYDRAGKNRLAAGVLLTVDNQIDPATGTVKLKAQFANDDYGLFPNQFVNARMLLDVKSDATLIPAAAVLRGTQGAFVYLVKPDSTVSVRPIKTGPGEGETVTVESGLAPGETVVVDGTDKLREGAKVELGGRDAAAAASGDGTHPGQGGKHRHDANATASGN